MRRKSRGPWISPTFDHVNPLQGPRESWLGSRQEKLHQLRGVATALGGSGPENGHPDLDVLCPRGHLPVSAQPHLAFGQESRPEATKTSGAPVLVACSPTRTRVVQVCVPPPTRRRTPPPGSGCFQLTQGPGKSSVGDRAGAGVTQPALGGLPYCQLQGSPAALRPENHRIHRPLPASEEGRVTRLCWLGRRSGVQLSLHGFPASPAACSPGPQACLR
ncbi:uncharacterized protein LOC123592762 [Leopardus geoffroyi]|uniref:uncharacterized protein LOC123592762 n=1 Tax=Leopardus geoffroyi TaxID=46844 RepID=UPI001E262F38|nr:uncharacterized protein LOC123592762 [Leopardus geoffroyi]